MPVLLRDLFVYPLDRVIPPVAKVSDTDAATVAMELGEYVPTRPIEEALARFLEVYADSRRAPTTQIGVWISGFFGSGKSHFAKILSYLLRNPSIGDDPDIPARLRGRSAYSIFLDRLAGTPRRADIEALLHRASLLDSHVIMFEIKAEEDQASKDETIPTILYRKYLSSRGLSTDPAVARLELGLMERGLYDRFKTQVLARTGNPWEAERDDVLFVESAVVDALQAVAPQVYHSREEARSAFQRAIQAPGLTISDLARQLVAYVDELAARGDRERPPRLVFIVDEIGMFIGTDGQRLEELRSLEEQFATLGQGKLWLVVTAQAKLDALIEGVRQVGDHFGRIGARFDTRLALTHDDVERVLEGRVLKKKPERAPDLESYYNDHSGALTGLSRLPGASRELPEMTREQFLVSTPFLPYHSPLIQAIFQEVKSSTSTGFQLTAEVRSMIGMAQGVLRSSANGFLAGQLGRLVSLDMVYDHIATNLQPQDRGDVDQLPSQLPDYQPLDSRLLKVLYLLQAVPWVAVGTDTLTQALVRDTETSLPALRAEVEASLHRLREARYVVAREDETWEFLTGTKKGFEEEVSTVQVKQIDLRRAARKALTEVLRPIGNLNYHNGLRAFDVAVRGDGEEVSGGEGMSLEVYSSLYLELAPDFRLDELEQIQSFSHPETVYWVSAASPDLRAYLTRQIRLAAVLPKWQDKATKTDDERQIIRDKDTELATLNGKIETALRVALLNGTLVWNGHAEELGGQATNLNPVFNRAMAEVVPHVYPRFELAAVKPTEKDIDAVLTMAPYALATVGAALDLFDQDGHLNQHSAVIDEVRRELDRRQNQGLDLSGRAVEEHFTGVPYGWNPINVRLIVAAMFRAGLVSVRDSNVSYSDYTAPAAQALFTQSRAFRRAQIVYNPDIPVEPGELRHAQTELRVEFDTTPKEETANVIAQQIREALQLWLDRSERLALQLKPAGYPVPDSLLGARDLCDRVTRLTNPSQVVKAFLVNLDVLRDWHEAAQTLYKFVVLQKHLLAYQTARRLVALADQARSVPDAARRFDDAAWQARDTLTNLIQSGRAAWEWERFEAAQSALLARFRAAYEALHAERAEALEKARAELEAAGLSAGVLKPYACAGLRWATDYLGCGECQAALHELPTQIVAIPPVSRQHIAREEQARLKLEEQSGKRVVYLPLAPLLGGRRIVDASDRDAALSELKSEIDQELQQGDIVVLS